jgi:predicted unusual protein kinase regulating ubiquinone biosynthesis (AarF/ABC1/UbiB family)
MGIDEIVGPQQPKAAGAGEATPDQLDDDLEAMGPTYVKLGQVLSGRPDLLQLLWIEPKRKLLGAVASLKIQKFKESDE